MKIQTLLINALILLAISTSCQKKSTNKEENKEPADIISRAEMIGDWKVQWITKPEAGLEIDPTVNYTMNGKMIFTDSKLTINAYGYKGCIFGSDTLSHALNWGIKGDTLNLINKGDEFGIPYIIKEASSDKIKLQLVEDVFLFLTR